MDMNKYITTSNLLNASKLKTSGKNGMFLTIKSIEEEPFVDKETNKESVAPVLTLVELDQRYKPNKTALKHLVKNLGSDGTKWIGKKIQLAVIPTAYQGQPTEGIAIIGLQ